MACNERRWRSIPACAGEPKSPSGCGVSDKVYPRVCGGTAAAAFAIIFAAGLSPRVRGNRRQAVKPLTRARSIPACAGEPGWRHERGAGVAVYPRVCGGTMGCAFRAGPPYGLSPRVRGNPHPAAPYRHRRRSIPACAGEPCASTSDTCRGAVYPRVCGGTRAAGGKYFFVVGLSPRVRGNRQVKGYGGILTRSIPACAGEPGHNWPAEGSQEVYPRVCGGTYALLLKIWSYSGLSPRVRGNPVRHSPWLRWQWSIPACAGEP